MKPFLKWAGNKYQIIHRIKKELPEGRQRLIEPFVGSGALFLGGQYIAWQQLNAAGVYIATNPSSSFFFLLTCVHAVHLIGGISALGYIDLQALRLRLGPGKRTAVDVSAYFWHFLDAIWIYLMVLFFFWG